MQSWVFEHGYLGLFLDETPAKLNVLENLFIYYNSIFNI